MRVVESSHHPDAEQALAEFGPLIRGKILTCLTRAGLEVAEAGANGNAWAARAQRDEVVHTLSDLLLDPSEAHLVSARVLLRRCWAVDVVERLGSGWERVWVDQIEANKGAA